MLYGEQWRSQGIIGLPLTVYQTLCTLRLAMGSIHGHSPRRGDHSPHQRLQ